jgi:cation diffusion facilitator CzcD-associated flavoprotein CzcO
VGGVWRDTTWRGFCDVPSHPGPFSFVEPELVACVCTPVSEILRLRHCADKYRPAPAFSYEVEVWHAASDDASSILAYHVG